LKQDNIQTVANINGNWKKGDDFENLKNAIQDAINHSMVSFKGKF